MATVLITGASRGIGRATAVELGRRGHRIVATARNPADLEGLAVDRALRLDVTDPESVAAAFADADGLDVVISNAGDTLFGPIEATPPAQFDRLFQTNVVGAVRLAQAALPTLRDRSGRLIFVSSLLGRTITPLSGAYCTSKWALEAMAETLAYEVAPFGVSVALVELPAVDTGVLVTAPTYTDPAYAPVTREVAALRFPFMRPDEAATAIADAVDADLVPLRIPVGEYTRRVLEQLKTMPTDKPSFPVPMPW